LLLVSVYPTDVPTGRATGNRVTFRTSSPSGSFVDPTVGFRLGDRGPNFTPGVPPGNVFFTRGVFPGKKKTFKNG